MSLIFGTVDRKNRLQSIYSDGMSTQGGNIVSTTDSKITSFITDGYTVCAGFCGIAYLNNYMRLHLQEAFMAAIDSKYGVPLEQLLPEVFNNILDAYAETFRTPKRAAEFTDYYSALLIVNGTFYRMEHFENERWHCMPLPDEIHYADGQGDVAARCLMECKVKPQKILDVVSKMNCHVSNHLSAIEKLSYHRSRRENSLSKIN